MSRYRAQEKELINRNALVSLAISKGYNAFLPVYDGGCDFILYNEATRDLKKVQLKGRWMIDKKYLDRDFWFAFPDRDNWYLVPHEELVGQADSYGFTGQASWTDKGAYSYAPLSKRMVVDLEPYRWPSIEEVSREAVEA